MKKIRLKNHFMVLLVFGFISIQSLAAQRITVEGTVLDEAGESMPGVNITVKGSITGVVTDVNGQFTIMVPDADAVLVFSFVGYISQEITVGPQRNLSVVLIEDVKQIGEVVVVGYGVQKKETVVGSVSTVKGDELLKSPATNLSNSIAGKMSGVVTMQKSGEVGNDDAIIRIRGSNTLGNNDPLIVIDGVAARAGGLNRLNPADIESMSVLKDASAAIYGARAANGVILITTKRGRTGKPQVTFASNWGWARPTKTPDMCNAEQYATLINERIYNSTMRNPKVEPYKEYTPRYSEEDLRLYRDGSDPWGHPDTDWFAETYKPWSPLNQQNLTIEGGTENVSYYGTVGHRYADGLYYNSANKYKQFDLRLNIDANINKWIKLGIGMMGRQEDRKNPSQGTDALWFISRGRPTDPAYWPNGLPGPAQEYGRNPVVAVTEETGYDKSSQYYIQTNGSLEITQPWIEGLKFTANISYDKFLMQGKRWFQPWYLYSWDGKSYENDGVTPKLNKDLSYPDSPDPNLRNRSEDQTNMVLGGILSYDRTFGHHGFNVVAGIEKDKSDNAYFTAYRRYFAGTVVQQLMAGGDAEQVATSDQSKNDEGNRWKNNWERARLNYFGRVAYNYKEKYLAEFVWRYDASYMFPEDQRYGFFPGFLLGYRISEEDFWKNNLSFIQYFKVRGSFGQMGNDQIWYSDKLQEYQYLSTYKYEYGYIIDNEDVKGLRVNVFPNPDITWERANNFNVGIEGRTLNNRLYFEVDYFYNRRSKILWMRNASIPQTAGLILPAENIGKMNNRGFDFKLEWSDHIGKDLRYNVTLSGGYAKNKIVYWDEAEGAPEWQRSTGRSMKSVLTDPELYYEFDGVFRNWDEINDPNRMNYDGITNDAGLQPGDMKFKDIDGDNKITVNDKRRFDKNNQPTWTGGLNLFAQYKWVDLTLFFQGAAGAWTRIFSESGDIGNYFESTFENRWSESNPTGDHPRVHNRDDFYWGGGTAKDNTYWMNKTDYIRLKNLEIGITAPDKWMQATNFFTSARVYFNCLNLFTITTAKELDPESVSSGGTNYPQSKIINIGVSVTF